MADQPVPVTMGSPRFTQCEVHGFLVTHVWLPPGASLHSHVHGRPTFAVILDGAFDLSFSSPTIRRKDLACPPGTVYTEPAGEKHANLVSSRGALGIVFQPDPDAPDLDATDLGVLDRIHHFRDGRIASIGRELAREVLASDPPSELAVEALALEMLAETARLTEDHRMPGDTSPWMVRAIEFVHAHFRDRLRIEDVAREAGVHPSHLAWTFRRTHRVSLGRYIRGLRVDWAAEQLTFTDDAIARIAVRAAFADQAHLTRVFKARMGSTPARYRRQRRTADSVSAASRSRGGPAPAPHPPGGWPGPLR